jgi:hypothetical protein
MAAPTDQKNEIVSPAEVPEDLPLPSDPKVIFLGGLFEEFCNTFTPKADIRQREWNVRKGPIADIPPFARSPRRRGRAVGQW